MNRDYTKLIGLIDGKEGVDYIDEINIKNPPHYKLEGLDIESVVGLIDVIKSILGEEGFKNFCYGNILKYVIRAKKKNGDEDFKKAKVYLEWYLEV